MASHNINIKITADASGVSKAVSSIKSQLSGLKGLKVGGEPLAGLESALGTLKGVVAGAFAVGSIAAFGKAALEASANAEVLRKGLTFQLGADQADLLISKMKEIGETSAYDGSALIPMARLWVNVGDNAETAISKMNKIVDAGSAYGLTQEQIQNCTLALTQMAGAGKIDSGNMNQLTNDGIPAWQLLSDAMGMPVEQLRDMASKGDLTADSLNALWDGLVAKTQGASAEMQGTLMSHFTNLEESAQNSLAGIGDIISKAFDVSGILETAGEYVDQFKEHIASINEAITAGGDPATAIINEISAVSPAIGAVVNTAVAGFNAIKAVISENITLIKNIAIGVTAAVAAYMGIMKLVSVFTAVKNAITVATVAMRLFGVAMTAVNVVSALNPVVLAIAAIIAIIALLVANWDTVKAAAVSAMAAVSNAIGGVADWLSSGFQSAVSAISSIFSSIAETVSSVISSIGEGISAAAEAISAVFTSIWETITASVTAAITTIEGIISAIVAWISTNVVTPIVDAFVSCINILVGAASILAAGIEATWGAIVAWVASNVTQPLVEAFQSAWKAVTESAMNAVIAISYAWDSVTDFFAGIWQSIVSAAQEAWQQVTEVAAEAWAMVSAAWDAAVAFFAALWASILSAAQSAWDTVTSVASSAWSAVQGAWEAASAWFQSTVWGPLCSAVSSVESAITGAFQAAYSAVTGLFSGLASWFESNVIAPIKEKFNALANIGSSITGMRTSSGAASVTAEAKGGINGGPMRLATGGLVGGRIPALANGGQIKNGTPAIVGEAGPEAVIPLRDEILAKIGEGIAKAYQKRNNMTENATDAEKAQMNAEDMLNDLRQSIVNEKGTNFESSMAQIIKDTADKRNQISSFAGRGANADTIKQLNEQLDVYSNALTVKANRDQMNALREYAATAKATYAEATHDYAAQAAAQYELTKVQLDKERQDKEKELMRDADDWQTKAVIAKDYYAKLAKAEEEYRQSKRRSHTKYIQYLQDEGNLAAVIADERTNSSRWDADAQLEGMKALTEKFVTFAKTAHASWASYAATIADDLYGTMTDSMAEFIKGARSAKSVLQDFGNSVLSMMAKIAAQRLAASWMTGLLGAFGGGSSGFTLSNGTSLDPSFGYTGSVVSGFKFAKGGIVTAPTMALIGEAGENEAVIPLNAKNLAAIGGKGKGGNVTINITNNTGSRVDAEQTTAKWDGEQWVVSVVLNAVATNQNGIRSMIKGVAST